MSGQFYRRLYFYLLRSLSYLQTRFVRNILFALIFLQILLSLLYWTIYNDRSSQNTISNIVSTASIAYYLSSTKQETDQKNPKYLDPDYHYFRSDSDIYSKSWWNYLPSSLYDHSDDINNQKLSKLSKLYEKLKFNTKPIWYDDYTLDNLLTIAVGPKKGEKVSSIDDLELYDFDPRLSWTVYLDYMTKNFEKGSKINAPFSWYDWTGFHELNKIISLKETRIGCNLFFEGAFDIEILNFIESEINEPLFKNERDKYENNKWYLFSRKLSTRHIFSVLSNHCQSLGIRDGKLYRPKFSTGFNITLLFDRVRTEVFQLQARNALLTSQKNPTSLTMVSDDGETFQIDLNQYNRSNIIESQMLHDFIKNEGDVFDIPPPPIPMIPTGITFDHEKSFTNFLSNETIKSKFRLNIKETDTEIFKDDYIYLNAEDFIFDAHAKIKELEAIPKDEISVHNLNYLNSLKNSVRTHPALAPKYFEECGNIQQFKGMGHHRDKRFFNGDDLINSHQEYFDRLNAMIRTFQKFTYNNGLLSWLGHGTLYGYIYNAQTFPWDNDFDLQMPITHLNYLAQYFNQSLILEDPRYGNGRFIVDVGDSITVRENGNGKNNIDARFIDVDTGLYIDITGLSVSSDLSKDSMKDYLASEATKTNFTYDRILKQYASNPLDKFKEEDENLARLNITQLEKYVKDNKDKFSSGQREDVGKLVKKETEEFPRSKNIERGLNPRERYESHKMFNLFNCRNDHFVNLEILSPLVNTIYHGVPTLIPTKYITALNNEYKVPPTYGYATFQGKTYLPDLRYWFKSKLIDKSSNLNQWYPTDIYTPLEKTKTLNNITFEDLWTILMNIKGSNEYNNNNIDLLANVFNSFTTSSYRLKELEIQYAGNISSSLKVDYLHLMRKEIAPKLLSPGKDPVMYLYERALYDELAKEFDQNIIQRLESAVQEKYIQKYWKLLSDLKYKNLDLFNISLPIDAIGPSNNDTFIDFNRINTPDLFNDPNKTPNKIFAEDTILKV